MEFNRIDSVSEQRTEAQHSRKMKEFDRLDSVLEQQTVV
jgi:hypothetical protein